LEHWKDWQKPFQFGTIVIWPPEDVRRIVDAQRERMDPVSQAICGTHITVTQPLTASLDNSAWRQVRAILWRHDPFKITYGPLNSFLPYPCIWYEIRPVQKVLDLRNALHDTGDFNLELRYTTNFIPHMTITEGLSGPTVNEVLLAQLQGESRPGSLPCDSLAYIVPDDHFRFHVEAQLPLGKSGLT